MVRLKRKKKEEIEEDYNRLLEKNISLGEALYVTIFYHIDKKKDIRKFLEDKLLKYKFEKLRETFRIVSKFPYTKKTEVILEVVAKYMLKSPSKKQTRA